MANIVQALFFALMVMFIIPFGSFAFAAEKWFGMVLETVDGDTVRVKHLNSDKIEVVRLYGVDSPEQIASKWKGQPYATSSRKFVQEAVQGQYVAVDVVGVDKYNRILGVIELENHEILQELLLSEGLTWVYEKYCDQQFCGKWRELQSQAQSKKIKIWSRKDAMEPWKWRKKIVDG